MISRHTAGIWVAAALVAAGAPAPAFPQEGVKPVPESDDLRIQSAAVRYDPELDLLVFEQRVLGRAGETVPEPRGRMDGAPVLAYVFPTDLSPGDVGYRGAEGILALAVTSHPDFDDTPLWDEDLDGDPKNKGDGRVYHTHWVVLVKDKRAAAGLAVKEIPKGEKPAVPTTHPGMPIYLDSPGFSVVLRGDTLRVPVPAWRVGGKKDFRFDAVTAYLEVNESDPGRPTLGVYKVYHVLSKDLSLPYRVSGRGTGGKGDSP